MDVKVADLDVTIGKKAILQDIHLEVQRHQMTGLLGPNGCGKSTLLRTLYRVIQPQKGTITFAGQPLNTYSPKEMAQQVAVVSQFNQLSFDFTVAETVLMGRAPHLKLLEQPKSADYQLVDRALKQVGLQTMRQQSVAELSGGEQQRVALARALVQDPSVMLLDEPSNHLDIKYQLEILRLLQGLQINTLAALHDLSLAAQFCDYVYVMKEGTIRYQGTPEEVITKEIIKDVYEVDCEVQRNPKTGHLVLSYY